MSRATIIFSSFHRSLTLAGQPLGDHLLTVCAESGLTASFAGPDELRGPGALVLLTARYPSVGPDSLRKLRDSLERGGGVLLASDGINLGACLPDGDPEQPLQDALDNALGPVKVTPEHGEDTEVHDLWGLAQAERVVRLRLMKKLAQSGVRFIDPFNTVVESTVKIGSGTTIWPGCVLRGQTKISENVEIESGVWMQDTQVGPGAVIKPHSVCLGAIIGPRAAVGPMAHLRPAAVLEESVKVGNFVEVKKSILRREAKASHLTYIGDADIGEKTNIGAGTITCNYDGFRKHPTKIGSNANIGSNTCFIAPVQVGDEVITGAGTIVSKDVEDGALAISRGEYRILKGRGRAIRERCRKAAEKES
jgi:carbonic anhydrase/acetyltransferase-like protein (isoleucine patch superfamily)